MYLIGLHFPDFVLDGGEIVAMNILLHLRPYDTHDISLPNKLPFNEPRNIVSKEFCTDIGLGTIENRGPHLLPTAAIFWRSSTHVLL